MTKNDVLRAKMVDEPYVRESLVEAFGKKGYLYSMGTVIDDWNHIDILQTKKGEQDVHIDVKRNAATQVNSENFTFTFINAKGKAFDFVDNGYFTFIDDVNGYIYLVQHSYIKQMVNTQNQYISKHSPLSKYIIIPKYKFKNCSTVRPRNILVNFF